MNAPITYKTLTIEELAPGMFVTIVILSERKNKVKNQGRVNSQRTIDSLKKQGVTEVIIKCEDEENTYAENGKNTEDIAELTQNAKNTTLIDKQDKPSKTESC